MLRGGFSLLIVFSFFPVFSQSFRDVTAEKGIFHVYGTNTFGGGVSFFDFNQDGWDDISLASDDGNPLSFYLNQNGQSFTKVMLNGVNETAQATQLVWVDYDNDDDPDLFVANANATSRLYRNDGNLQFTNVTYNAWLPLTAMPTYAVCWGDYDRDGWIDLYVSNRVTSQYPFSNYLYRNRGDGTFEDVTLTAAVADSAKAPLAVTFTDINGDLYPDIYIAQDKFYGNTLLRNNGDGTFTDISQSSGTDVQMDGMGIANGDFDNDGDLDLYVSNSPPGNKLFVNNGDESFMEKANMAGVGFFGTGWGTNFLDFDQDGDLDLYASGLWFPTTQQPASTFYVNQGDGSFKTQANTGFQGDTARSYGNAVGDIDNDGFPDLMVNNLGQPGSHLWQNTGNASHWLKVRLKGSISNRQGVGSWIECWQNGQKQVRFTHCGISYMGQNSGTSFFGLHTNPTVDSLRVFWPSGQISVLIQPGTNQLIDVLEDGSPTSVESPFAAFPLEIIQEADAVVIKSQPQLDVQLLDLFGRKLFIDQTNPLGSLRIPTTDFAEGYYLLRCQKGGRHHQQKLFIF